MTIIKDIISTTIQSFLYNQPISNIQSYFVEGRITDFLVRLEGIVESPYGFRMRDDEPEPPQGMMEFPRESIVPPVMNRLVKVEDIEGEIPVWYEGSSYTVEIEVDSHDGTIRCWSPLFDELVATAKKRSQE